MSDNIAAKVVLPARAQEFQANSQGGGAYAGAKG